MVVTRSDWTSDTKKIKKAKKWAVAKLDLKLVQVLQVIN